VPLALLRNEPLVGLNRLYPTYDEWLRAACRREGFAPKVVKEADGAASALAFVAAGFGLAVVSQPVEKVPAQGVAFRELTSQAAVRRLESRWGLGRRGLAVCRGADAGLRRPRRGGRSLVLHPFSGWLSRFCPEGAADLSPGFLPWETVPPRCRPEGARERCGTPSHGLSGLGRGWGRLPRVKTLG
jgi:DNA-binding transcriptional LysR family regulator